MERELEKEQTLNLEISLNGDKMEERKNILDELIKTSLPKPKEFDKLSIFKNLIKTNIDLFPSEIKLGNIYNRYAKVYGFKNWHEFKKTLIDDSIVDRDRMEKLNFTKEKNIGDFEMFTLIRVRCPIFVYVKNIPEGFIPQFLEEEKYREILFYKNSILQLIPHPENPLLGILRFYSDDLISEGNKKDILKKNIHMNSIIINLDKKFSNDILSIIKIPRDCKQFVSDFSIPNDYYNPEELFNNIGKVYQGGIYGSGK